MKRVISGILYTLAAACVFAGDVAVFQDMGFSADGKTYLFAEYGRTDTSFQGYANIYTVDVAGNDFISGGVFSMGPSASTSGQNGYDLYKILSEKNRNFISGYDCTPVSADQKLYVRKEDSGASGESISFKDFKPLSDGNAASVYYSVRLVPHTEKDGADILSSFFIVLEKKDGNNMLLERTVIGNPQVRRRGVSGYVINSIFTDKSGKSLVFLIEKIMDDPKGVSVRYMVETYRYE